MVAADVEGHLEGFAAVVQSLQLRRLRVVVSGLREGAARATGQTSNGRGAVQTAILKG